MDDIATLGPFFAVDSHPYDAIPIPPWLTLLDLVEQRELLMSRISVVRSALAGGRPIQQIEAKVAASVTHLGLVARLIAPAVALVVTAGQLPCTDLSRVWWQDELGGAFPLSLPDAHAAAVDHDQPVELAQGVLLLREKLIDSAVRALTDAVAATVPVSLLVLRGNVASAINSATTLIGSQRAGLAHSCRAVADMLLQDPELNPSSSPTGRAFRRASCCLIYRASAARTISTESTCGDCVLATS